MLQGKDSVMARVTSLKNLVEGGEGVVAAPRLKKRFAFFGFESQKLHAKNAYMAFWPDLVGVVFGRGSR